jgi:hypothetical protein
MPHLQPVYVVLTATLLTVFATAGYAAEAEGVEASPKPSFETMDSNLDGLITPDEAEGSWLASVFTDADANQDGLINREEYETALG